ncbi:MAG: riboflavin biosynthesis protein RibF [Phycisphaerae bacterium]
MAETDNSVIRLSADSPAPRWARGCALTVGNFDGVHAGHQRMIRLARSLAAPSADVVVVLTFDPLPERILRPESAPPLVVPPERRFELLRLAGADLVLVVAPDRDLLEMAPEEFIEKIVDPLRPQWMVEGPDFRFGRDRGGDAALLQELGGRHGFEVCIAEPATVDIDACEQRISSTLVRELVADGRVEDAARCLDRPFAMHGRVIHGAGQGRVLEFPTANLPIGECVVPADGVYAAQAELPGGTYAAAVSVGNKPTLGPAPKTVEAFLLDAEGTFYDEQMHLWFLRRLRDQRKFSGIDELKAQIAKDVHRVREICGS